MRPSPPKAFLFDIDGTLIDSNDFHAQAWKKAFAEGGRAVPYHKIRPQIGKGADQLLPVFLSPHEVKSEGEKLADRAGEIFKREFLAQVRPFPKVRELFKFLQTAGARIALASSSKAELIEEFKIIAQIGDLVEKSASADEAKASKPQPDIFQAALQQLGNPAVDTVMVVGDTPYDAIAACKAKLPVSGVLCGGFPEAALRAAGCQAIYEDPADMLVKLAAAWHL